MNKIYYYLWPNFFSKIILYENLKFRIIFAIFFCNKYSEFKYIILIYIYVDDLNMNIIYKRNYFMKIKNVKFIEKIH